MDKNLDYYKSKAKEWNSIEDDFQRLVYLKENQQDFLVLLDNDWTFVVFKNVKENLKEQVRNIDLMDFDEYHYSSEWNLILFKFAWIEAEFV